MREIKFRVYDKTGGYYIAILDNDCFSIKQVARIILELEVLKHKYVIEQDTGLKDKNGKEIYEGDIVEALIDGVWAIDNSLSFGKVKWKLEVIYNDIRFMDVFRVIGSKNAPDRIYYLFDKELSELEVIGNIHENPELLETKEEG